MTVKRVAIMLIGVAAVAGAGYLLADRFYLRRASELHADIERARSAARALDRAIDERHVPRGRLDAAIGTTLGRDPELVEHRLRAGLGRLAREHGLGGVVVSNASPRGVANPAGEIRVGRSGTWREFRDNVRARADFYVLAGRLEGAGTQEAALRTLAAVRAQPWIHRVEGFTLRPVGRDRETYELKVDFVTLFSPDLGPREVGEAAPELAAVGESDSAYVGRVLAQHMFKAPPAPPPTPEPPVRVAHEPPPPAYGGWRLAGLTVTDHAEAIMVGPSGESRVLAPGDEVEGAVFEGGEGETGIFVIEGARYEIELGRTLADRRGLDE